MEKKCPCCHVVKNVEEFYKWKYSKDGLTSYCKQCDNAKNYRRLRKKSQLLGKKYHIPTLEARELRKNRKKYCPDCKTVKSFDEFYLNERNAVDGLDSQCTECKKVRASLVTKEKLHEYYEKRKRKQLNWRLLRKFKISLDQYEDLLKKQNNKCAICEIHVSDNGKNLAVDHNHATGENRGLLCSRCNAGLGFILENKQIALNMIKYIDQWKEI